MKTKRTRRVTTAVSTGLAVLAAAATLFVWRNREKAQIAFHESGDLSILMLEREAYAAERPAATTAITDPRQRRYYLSEPHSAKLFGIGRKKDVRVYDPWCYYRNIPHRKNRVKWAEHPDGGYLLETNSDGLRDTESDPGAAHDLRVLVAGDSHTFGVCNVDEIWANRLEARLGEAFPGHSIDVLNAAMGGFTFYNYLGTLEKYLADPPDVFVVGVYAGNDFTELVQLRTVFEGADPPPRLTEEQILVRKTAGHTNAQAMGQCYNAAWSFKVRPTVVIPVLETAVDLVDQMRALCEAHGIHFVVALIPAPCELEWDPPVESFAEMRALLDLDDGDCAVVDKLADRFLMRVGALGVTTVDMRPTYSAMSPPPYWRKDQHLDVRGHEELAASLEPIIAGWAVETGRLESE